MVLKKTQMERVNDSEEKCVNKQYQRRKLSRYLQRLKKVRNMRCSDKKVDKHIKDTLIGFVHRGVVVSFRLHFYN